MLTPDILLGMKKDSFVSIKQTGVLDQEKAEFIQMYQKLILTKLENTMLLNCPNSFLKRRLTLPGVGSSGICCTELSF